MGEVLEVSGCVEEASASVKDCAALIDFKVVFLCQEFQFISHLFLQLFIGNSTPGIRERNY